MSIFPFQFMNDLMPSPSSSSEQDHAAGSDASSTEDGSMYSDSVMMSGISTDPTTALTLPGDAASVQTTDSPAAPVYGDHGAVTGIPPGTFIEIYREHLARTVHVPVQQHSDNDDDETQGSEFGGTIISSAPSGTDIEPPPLHESWHITSYPRPIHRDNLSISTTESMYRDLVSLHHEQDDQSIPENREDHSSSFLGIGTDASPLSLNPSMMDSSITVTTGSDVPGSSSSTNPPPRTPTWETHGDRPSTTTSHERDTFLHVADRLARQSQPPPPPPDNDTNHCAEWYVRFTEVDWLTFQRDATMILAALKDSNDNYHEEKYDEYDRDLSTRPPPIPPPLPEHVQSLPISSTIDTDTVMPSYCAADVLPKSFICILCKDVIVGSTTLDCGCAQSAVCTICWERHQIAPVSCANEDDDDELEDLVHVVPVHANTNCPFCTKSVGRAMPCHALDVAILHCVNSLPDHDKDEHRHHQYHPIKMAYYHRLEAWRLEVECRHQEFESECQGLVRQRPRILHHNNNSNNNNNNNQQQVDGDALLAELMEAEEKYFWKKEQQLQQQQPKSFWQSNKHLLIVVAELALVASAAAFHGSSRGSGGGIMRGTLLMPR